MPQSAPKLPECDIRKAQDRFLTRTGHIKFFSEAPMENIEAHNRQVTVVLDVAKGEIAYKVIMKSFEFEKAAMQDHFNAQYLHTDKFPNAQFEGTIGNIASINFKKDGSYPAQVSGKLTIHGVTKDVKQTGTITVKGGNVSTQAKFTIKLADYNAQSLLDEVDKTDSSAVGQKPKREKVYGTFYGTRLINGHTIETNPKGSFVFIISHRFGRVNSGFYEFFGLDNSTVRFGFEYAVLDNLMLGFGRSSNGAMWDGF
eukprot:gene299-399_t